MKSRRNAFVPQEIKNHSAFLVKCRVDIPGGVRSSVMKTKIESATPLSIRRRAGTPKEMSQIYGIPLGTLANLRYQKRGPKYFRRGRGVLYFFSDFESWLKSNPVLTKDSCENDDVAEDG